MLPSNIYIAAIKMLSKKLFVVIALTLALVGARHIRDDEDECETKCNLPNCRCSATEPPLGLDPQNIPQLVLLTFDDAVQITNYDYYNAAFFGKKNPDGCPIGVTYFVSHEYTDYSLLHSLYQQGHEVALHSITHTTMTQYWREASVELLNKEFAGLRDIITKFANIPEEHVYGARIPFLQMSGDNSTRAMQEMGLLYDCSWPTQTYMDPGLWPYTLDYPTIQDCPIGPCPQDSLPGFWIQPMINMKDNSGVNCAMADACVDVPTDVDGLFEYMVRNFEVQYKGNRAPYGFYVHAAWFGQDPVRFEAYQKFVDYLISLEDVYIVNVHRAIEWMQNPHTLDEIKQSWPTCVQPEDTPCTPTMCRLMKGNEERYMKICGTTCPKVYPWIDNPLGA